MTIIGAYISLQTARELLAEEMSGGKAAEALELYDTALKRLDSGVNELREAVHNLAPVAALGVETLRETCGRFPACEVRLAACGDLSVMPIYCWNLLEACLNEAFTNIVRHAEAQQVTVELDATPNLVRLSIENDGAKSNTKGIGIGLRNLRHRAASVGENLSVDTGEVCRVICVIPIRERQGEKK